MRFLFASALTMSLVLSTPAWAEMPVDAVPATHAFSRAIPPETVISKIMPVVFRSGVRPRAVPAVVTPQTTIPRPSHAIVEADDDAPHLVPAVAFRELDGDAVRIPTHSGMDASTRCVAMAVYHEARGESVRGQRAVADVVLNRARSGRWGANACNVVNAPHQFTNRWSWTPPVQGVASWDRAVSIARDAMSGMIGVSSHLMNFRAASMGAGGRSSLRIGNHAFW